MDVFDLWPLAYMQRLLVVCICLLGAEGPCLLFVALARRRRWWTCLLALTPAAVFAWGVYLEYSLRVALGPWWSDILFEQAHYPARYWLTFAMQEPAGVRAALSALPGQVVTLSALTLGLLVFGWAFLLRRENVPRRGALLTPPAQPPDSAPEPPDGEEGILDMRVEPLERDSP